MPYTTDPSEPERDTPTDAAIIEQHERVVDLQETLEHARDLLYLKVADAADGGVTMTHLAAILGVSRQWLYRAVASAVARRTEIEQRSEDRFTGYLRRRIAEDMAQVTLPDGTPVSIGGIPLVTDPTAPPGHAYLYGTTTGNSTFVPTTSNSASAWDYMTVTTA